MQELITNLQVKDFLDDYQIKSEISFLEESSKEKNELIEVAKKRGIIVKDSKDLAIIKTIYAFTDQPNANGAILPEKELLKVLPQIVGKPMNRNHIRDQIRGVYVDYNYIPKEKKIVTYATFFKDVYAEEWEEAKALQKIGRLSTSFEIWSNKETRKYRDNGTYELHEMEMAGGGLLFDYPNKDPHPPAFSKAKVLELSKKVKECVGEECLVCAEKYSEEDIIVAKTYNCECIKCGYKLKSDKHCKDLKCPKCKGQMRRVERPGVGNPKKAEEQIKCSNCGYIFSTNPTNNSKCPNCKAIVDQNGKMLAPAQEINFKLKCPNEKCNAVNWMVKEESESEAKIKCLSCNKDYKVNFRSDKKDLFDFSLAEIIRILPDKTFTCLQCGNTLNLKNVKGISENQSVILQCNKCTLRFERAISNLKVKTISTIEELEQTPQDINKDTLGKTEQGGKDMIKELASFYKEDSKVEIEGKKLTYKERKNITDDMFAVVKTVKNEVTGKPRKIRMFPIQDEAHVRNALARLPQAKETLAKLGISVMSVYRKIIKRAKELNMTDLLKKHEKSTVEEATIDGKEVYGYVEPIVETPIKAEDTLKSGIKKLASKLINYKDIIEKYERELAEVKEKHFKELQKSEDSIKFYKENAVKIANRREELGQFSEDINDEQILDEKEYENALLKKELAEKKEIEEEEIENSEKKRVKTHAQRAIDNIAYGL